MPFHARNTSTTKDLGFLCFKANKCVSYRIKNIFFLNGCFKMKFRFNKVTVTTMVTPRGNKTLAFQVSLQILDKKSFFPKLPCTEQHPAEKRGPKVTLWPGHAWANNAGEKEK